MKVMVTGGSGFIGSHVVDKLIDRGIEVRIYDLIYPEFIDEMPEKRRKLVGYYQGSLLEEDRIRAATANMDAIYHLAAVANVNDVAKDPQNAQRINVQGTFNVLEAARINPNIKRVLYASTVWIYQDTPQGTGILSEDAPISLPSHFYTATKMFGEAACTSYSKLFNVPTTILRFGVPYGTRARGEIVSAIFVKKALNGEPITIAGDGSQYRKFVYVEDLAEGCVLALKDIGRNKIYNLEGEEKVSVRQIAETVNEIIGGVNIVYTEGRKGDFTGKDISNQIAKKELGWVPSTSFKDGMRKYIAWYKEKIHTKGKEVIL
jgi:UDP-glucose 4-epimerase